MYPTLSDCVAGLDSAGELKRISRLVSPICEIASLAHAESRKPAPNLPSISSQRADPAFHHLGGSALLFEHVEGSDIPVLINSLGSYRRMEMALGCEEGGFAQIADRIAKLVKPQPPSSFDEAIAMLGRFAPLLRMGPKRVRRGLCQQVVKTGEAIDLRELPIIRCWPRDGDFAALGYPPGINDHIPGALHDNNWNDKFRGRYITLAGIHTIHAADAGSEKPASHNIGMYRVQLLGPRLMTLHMQLHHDGAAHWRSWKKLGKPMPIAIAFGGSSVLPYAATCPLPPGISELLMAGFLQGRGIRMVRCKTVPMWVPADSEIVIEGVVSTKAGHPGWSIAGDEPLGPGAAFEGPFGDHTGFYSLPDRYPQLHVTALTHRKKPIFPATVVGMPPQEDYFLGKATERIMLPLLRTIVPDLQDYDLPMFGAFHNAAFVQIDKQYPLHARRMMHSVWGAGQMSWTKNVFVVDRDVDVHDTCAVLCAMAEHCDPRCAIEQVRGPLDVLDHAAPYLGAGAKLGFDCTRKWPSESVGRYKVDPSDGCAGSDGCHETLRPQHNRGELSACDSRADFVSVAGAIGNQLAAHILDIPGVIQTVLPEALPGFLFVKIDKTQGEIDKPGLAQRTLEAIETITQRFDWRTVRPPAFVIVVGGQVELDTADEVLFHWVANFDASRDLKVWSIAKPTPSHSQTQADGSWGIAGFEAAPKARGDERNSEPVRDWPPVLEPVLGL